MKVIKIKHLLRNFFFSGLALLFSGVLSCGGNLTPGNPSPGNPAPDTAAPTVEMIFPPSAHFSTKGSSLLVRGSAQDVSGVRKISVNGIPAVSEDNFANWQAEIPLIPGKNPLVVETEDALGNHNPQAVTSSILSSPFLTGPTDVISDNGSLYVLDAGQGAILRISEEEESAEILFDNDKYPDDAELSIPISFVMDRYDFYVVNFFPPQVLQIPKEGGPAKVFFDDNSYPDDDEVFLPLQITMDEEFIYLLTDFYSVVRIPKFEGGGGARILNMDYLGFPLDMAMDDDFLYVLDVAYLRVLAFPKEGGAATVIFHNGIDPNDPELVWGDSLTIDGDFLYVADIDRILRIPKAGNQPAELAVDSTSDIDPWSFSFSGMAVEGDKLYLTSYGRNALYRASLNGETSYELIFDDDVVPNTVSLIGYPSMAVDEDFLYLVNSVGFGHELVRLAKAGGSIEVLFKDETFPDDPIALSTSAIAVDDDFVYTETFGGTVGGGKIVGIPKEGGKPAQLIFHDGSAADDYNLINPVALATDNSEEASLYVLDYDRNAVLRIPKRGGKSTLVNQDPLSRSLDMVLDGDDLYVLQYNLDLGRTEVLRILRAGGPSQLVFGDEPAPYAYNGASRLAVDEVNLYVGHVNSQEIIAIPKESGEPAQVFFNRDSDLQDANMLIPARLIAGENALYVADPGLDAVLLIDKKTQKSAVFLGL